ncbi:hypothetical protein GCM10015535_12220 [Streptomyces gelaticus]|uniref:Tyr recombinase domain-containing protein n=1 Tax=Streptomyces gelaticus TaxID=285446 RepID=A0ABQ2VT48_9ACTN|nr:hypothetical protein GCM10015535_12220 [Streptomyces gelaticus]
MTASAVVLALFATPPRVQSRELKPWGLDQTTTFLEAARQDPLYAAFVSRSFQRITEEAGLPRIRLHGARHGCATLLFAAGVPARVVMEILGHSQIAVTTNIYTHVSDDNRREAMGHMDRLLRRRRPSG